MTPVRNESSIVEVNIAIFARAPVPGESKTRLIPALGAQGAAQLHHTLINRSLETVHAVNARTVSLWCTPDCAHPDFVAWAQRFNLDLYPQQGANLGARMHHAFAQLCRQRPTLLIGTDCPALTVAELRAAAAALLSGDSAVIIPAEDGGYVLIGLRRPSSSLFRGVAWGGNTVMDETRKRMQDAGVQVTELASSWDVDRPADLARLSASGLLVGLLDEVPKARADA